MCRNWKPHTKLRECKMLQPFWKTVWQFLKWLNVELHMAHPFCSWVSTREKWNIHLHKNMFMAALFITAKNGNNLNVYQLMNHKYSVVYLHSGIVSYHKREYYYMLQHEWTLKHAKWKKLDTKCHTVWFHLYEMSRKGNSLESGSSLEIARGFGEGRMRNDY